jgi:membrane protein
VLLFTVYSAILVLVSGRWIFQFLETEVPILQLLIQWNWIRFIVLFLLIFGWCTCSTCSPRRGQNRGSRWRAPPAPWPSPWRPSACSSPSSYGFSSCYSLVYGSLAAIIILMVWLYFCGIILLLGAAFNASALKNSDGHYRLKHQTESQTVSMLRDPLKGYEHIKKERKRKERRSKG